MARSFWTDSNGDGAKEWADDPPTGDTWFEFDSDGDGMTNAEEALFGSDPYRLDSDYDGLTDKDERDLTLAMNGGLASTVPWVWDTDGDHFSDRDEYYQWLQGTPMVSYAGLSQFYTYFDADGDGIHNPDDSDPTNNDRDSDGIVNWLDSGFMDDPTNGGTPQDTTTDTDGDGTPDHSDPYPRGSYFYNGMEYGGTFIDSDGDSIPDSLDPFPNGSYWYEGTEYGGVLPDRDGDGLADWADGFPDGSFVYEGVEYHGPLLDEDGDGVPNGPDPFPSLSGSHTYGGVIYGGIWQDADSDSIPDWADPCPAGSYWYNNTEYGGAWADQDNDGIPDPADLFPTLTGGYWYNGTEYGGYWADADNDGVPDAADLFPNGSYWYQGMEYAGDWVDADGDWIPDPADPFPNGGSYWYNGTEYAGPWPDTDNDGIPDSADSYPNGSYWHGGTEYGGTWVDSDQDSIPDPADAFPADWWNGQPHYSYEGIEYPGLWADRDGDDVPDPADNWPDDEENGLDSDGDGLDNYAERTTHHTNANDVDSDNDFLTDYEELFVYHSNPMNARSVVPDQTSLDFFWVGAETDLDQDGLPDHVELHYQSLGYDLNPDNDEDAWGDLDSDGYTNLQAYHLGRDLIANLSQYDMDGDGISDATEDYWNALYPGMLNKTLFADAVLDFDGDWLLNYEEVENDYHPGLVWSGEFAAQTHVIWRDGNDVDPSTSTDFESLFWAVQDPIFDSTGYGYEGWYCPFEQMPPVGPLAPPNYWRIETDNAQRGDWDKDGLPDVWEYRHKTHLRDSSDKGSDLDNDGLTNLQEFQHQTHPRVADSDGDGFRDGFEVTKNTSPTSHQSTPIQLATLQLTSAQALVANYQTLVASNAGSSETLSASQDAEFALEKVNEFLQQLSEEAATGPSKTKVSDLQSQTQQQKQELPSEIPAGESAEDVAVQHRRFYGEVDASGYAIHAYVDSHQGLEDWDGNSSYVEQDQVAGKVESAVQWLNTKSPLLFPGGIRHRWLWGEEQLFIEGSKSDKAIKRHAVEIVANAPSDQWRRFRYRVFNDERELGGVVFSIPPDSRFATPSLEGFSGGELVQLVGRQIRLGPVSISGEDPLTRVYMVPSMTEVADVWVTTGSSSGQGNLQWNPDTEQEEDHWSVFGENDDEGWGRLTEGKVASAGYRTQDRSSAFPDGYDNEGPSTISQVGWDEDTDEESRGLTWGSMSMRAQPQRYGSQTPSPLSYVIVQNTMDYSSFEIEDLVLGTVTFTFNSPSAFATISLIKAPGLGVDDAKQIRVVGNTLFLEPHFMDDFTGMAGRTIKLLPVEFVTKGLHNELVQAHAAVNGTATPVIDAQVTGCSVSANGVVTLDISGTVGDATSDLIDTPAKQLQSLQVLSPGGSQTINLSNSDGGEELPWKPYKWGSNFSATTSFTATGPGDFPVSITTDINAGGMAGSTTTTVKVSRSTTEIELSNLADDTVDSLRFFENSSTSGNEELMTETSADSWTFTFPSSSANMGLRVEILASTLLTEAVDTLHVRIHRPTANGGETLEDHDFVETGATTNHFAYSQLTAACGSFPKNDAGFFLPIMLRLPVLDCFEATDFKIETMGREWRLKRKNFGDGEYCYIVDDQENAVVFNPACFAHTHIQTKPIDEKWYFEFRRAGNNIGKVALEQATGLIVRAPVSDDIIADGLDPATWVRDGKIVEGGTIINFRPRKNTNGNPSPVVMITNGQDVKPEILWRYVTANNRVIYFGSGENLVRDIAYRRDVVASARSARFAYIGDGSNPEPVRLNPTYWHPIGTTLNTPAGTIRVELKGNTTASLAIADVFTNPQEYAVACQGGALFVALRAISQTVGNQKFDAATMNSPQTFGPDLFNIRYVADADETFWIPGDWGNIQNLDHNPADPAQQNREGENMIYLGGSISTDLSTFKANALFWGHGMNPDAGNIMTLGAMMQQISGWGRLQIAKIRRDLKIDHPQLK